MWPHPLCLSQCQPAHLKVISYWTLEPADKTVALQPVYCSTADIFSLLSLSKLHNRTGQQSTKLRRLSPLCHPAPVARVLCKILLINKCLSHISHTNILVWYWCYNRYTYFLFIFPVGSWYITGVVPRLLRFSSTSPASRNINSGERTVILKIKDQLGTSRCW